MKSLTATVLIILLTGVVISAQNQEKNEILYSKYLSASVFDSALYYAEESAAVLRGTKGEKTPEFADALSRLTKANYYLGNYIKAGYYCQRESELRKSLKINRDAKYLESLVNLVIINIKSANFDLALECIENTESFALKLNGAQSLEYANALSLHGNVYTAMGSSVNDMIFIKKAKEYYLKAEQIFLQKGTDGTAGYIANRANQAIYFNNLGNSPMAETYLQEVIALTKKEYGSSSLAYASALNNIGVFYYNNGFYKQAENHLVQAIDVYKASSSNGSMNLGVSNNNLGALYYDIGNYSIAEKFLSEAEAVFKNYKQTESPDYGIILNNQTTINLSREYYASPSDKNRGKLLYCGKVLILADSIWSKNCRLPQNDGFAIKNNLSLWYKMIGESKKSLKLVYDITFLSNMSGKPIAMVNKMRLSCLLANSEGGNTQAIIDPAMIPVKVKMTDHMNNDEQLRLNTQNQDESTRFILKLVIGDASRVKDALGPFHPAYADLMKSYIPLYKSIGAYDMEEQLTLEYMKVINHNILQDFSFLSESEKEMYLKTKIPDMNAFLSYLLIRKDVKPEITSYAYNQVIQNKGLMLKSSTAMRQAILNSKNTNLLKSYDDWQSLQKEISALYATPVEMRTKNLSELEAKANTLERNLVQESQTFSDYRKGMQVTWTNVRDNLKQDEAAIEFIHFNRKERDLGNVVYYCALILRANSEFPVMIKLFEEKELTAILGTNEVNNVEYITRLYGTKENPSEALYNLIWKPIEESLQGAKKVYISPSGLLYKVSFAGMSSGKNVYLCDQYEVQIKGSTGNIAKQEPIPTGSNLSALVFGGIKYSDDAKGTQMWDYLNGTRKEADAVCSILKKNNAEVSYLSENSATETYLKLNAQNYNILHVATHGFFFPDPNEQRFSEQKEEVEVGEVAFRGASRGFGVNSFVNNLNPLMRSGLVLAGANDVWNKSELDKPDDGVLTAQEVTQMDMRKNILVVLSACETGLGDIKGSEGVYGLQRAFKMAGVKNIIMSLWQVPDKETVEFMELFYSKLAVCKDIKQAFSETQTAMRKKYDPYYWAAFMLME